jgi:hypothetical protein
MVETDRKGFKAPGIIREMILHVNRFDFFEMLTKFFPADRVDRRN